MREGFGLNVPGGNLELTGWPGSEGVGKSVDQLLRLNDQ